MAGQEQHEGAQVVALVTASGTLILALHHLPAPGLTSQRAARISAGAGAELHGSDAVAEVVDSGATLTAVLAPCQAPGGAAAASPAGFAPSPQPAPQASTSSISSSSGRAGEAATGLRALTVNERRRTAAEAAGALSSAGSLSAYGAAQSWVVLGYLGVLALLSCKRILTAHPKVRGMDLFLCVVSCAPHPVQASSMPLLMYHSGERQESVKPFRHHAPSSSSPATNGCACGGRPQRARV